MNEAVTTILKTATLAFKVRRHSLDYVIHMINEHTSLLMNSIL